MSSYLRFTTIALFTLATAACGAEGASSDLSDTTGESEAALESSGDALGNYSVRPGTYRGAGVWSDDAGHVGSVDNQWVAMGPDGNGVYRGINNVTFHGAAPIVGDLGPGFTVSGNDVVAQATYVFTYPTKSTYTIAVDVSGQSVPIGSGIASPIAYRSEFNLPAGAAIESGEFGRRDLHRQGVLNANAQGHDLHLFYRVDLRKH